MFAWFGSLGLPSLKPIRLFTATITVLSIKDSFLFNLGSLSCRRTPTLGHKTAFICNCFFSPVGVATTLTQKFEHTQFIPAAISPLACCCRVHNLSLSSSLCQVASWFNLVVVVLPITLSEVFRRSPSHKLSLFDHQGYQVFTPHCSLFDLSQLPFNFQDKTS